MHGLQKNFLGEIAFRFIEYTHCLGDFTFNKFEINVKVKVFVNPYIVPSTWHYYWYTISDIVLKNSRNVDYATYRYCDNETIEAVTRELKMGITANSKFLTGAWSTFKP